MVRSFNVRFALAAVIAPALMLVLPYAPAQKAAPSGIAPLLANHRDAIHAHAPFSCHEWGGGCMLVSTQLTEDALSRHFESVAASGLPRRSYVVQGWISTTATNGSNFPLRSPITVTYSFLLDGVVIPGAPFVGDEAGASNLQSITNSSFPGGYAAFKAKIALGFARLGELTGITFVETFDDGAGFPGFPGAINLRGDIRIGMHPIGQQAAAYAYYPNVSDMVFDSDPSDVALFINGQDNHVILRNVLMHEAGHAIGLAHVGPNSRTKLMETVVGAFFDGPQEDDIRGLQRLYGDPHELNESAAAAAPAGSLNDGTITLAQLALEDSPLNDYYQFHVPENAAITITLDPVGSTYSVGPSGGTYADVDAKRINDLAFELRGAGGLSVLATADAAPAGDAERLAAFTPGPAGDYYVRVYSITGVSDVQRYALSIEQALAASQIVNHILGRESLTPEQMAAADRNSNGKVEAGDLIQIIANP